MINKENKMEKQTGQAPTIIPKYAPDNPPRDYSKRKSVSVFFCIRFSSGLRCPELLRARITARGGDIYVIPFTEYGIDDYHLSYHDSGKLFHWTCHGTHIQPVYMERDFSAAFGILLKMKYPLCFCFRKGKNLEGEEITELVSKLNQNIPFDINEQDACRSLVEVGFFRLVLEDLK